MGPPRLAGASAYTADDDYDGTDDGPGSSGAHSEGSHGQSGGRRDSGGHQQWESSESFKKFEFREAGSLFEVRAAVFFGTSSRVQLTDYREYPIAPV